MRMNTKKGEPHSTTKSRNTFCDSDEPLTLPKPGKGLPFPALPAKLVVAIDGWAQTGKNTVGELVAEHLGGVLVDSGRFYRALTKACVESRVNLDNQESVVEWCKGVVLDVRLAREGGKVEEAQVAVNRRWFTKEELRPMGLQTSQVAAIPKVRELVNAGLQLCECYGRIVVLGRDIAGEVFPDTLFKIFLDASEEVREKRHFATTKSYGAVQRDIRDRSHIVFSENALMIDTSKLVPQEVAGIILVEVFWRASEARGTRMGL